MDSLTSPTVLASVCKLVIPKFAIQPPLLMLAALLGYPVCSKILVPLCFGMLHAYLACCMLTPARCIILTSASSALDGRKPQLLQRGVAGIVMSFAPHALARGEPVRLLTNLTLSCPVTLKCTNVPGLQSPKSTPLALLLAFRISSLSVRA